MARVVPSRFGAKSEPANRVGKIFIDPLRDSHGATTAAAFSARARPRPGVSLPVPWDRLADLEGGAQRTITTAHEHLSFQALDPRADDWTTKQSITKPLRALQRSSH